MYDLGASLPTPVAQVTISTDEHYADEGVRAGSGPCLNCLKRTAVTSFERLGTPDPAVLQLLLALIRWYSVVRPMVANAIRSAIRF